MIRKRRSLSSEKKKRVSTPPRRGAVPVRRRGGKAHLLEEEQGQPEIVASTPVTDKRALILTHLQSRRVKPAASSSRTGVFLGVILSAVIVCVGWFMTFGVSLRTGMSSGDGLLEILRGRSEQLREELRAPTDGVKSTLEAFEANQAAQEAVLEQVAEEIRRGQASSTGGATGSMASTTSTSR